MSVDRTEGMINIMSIKWEIKHIQYIVLFTQKWHLQQLHSLTKIYDMLA